MHPSYLSKILKETKNEVFDKKSRSSIRALKSKINDLPAPLPFASPLIYKIQNRKPAVIAEVKKSSPSKGIIRQDFNHIEIAKSYLHGGADCLSILTNKPFFSGELEYIKEVRLEVDLPILRKDFIIDDYQVYESRNALADCILLIVAALTKTQLEDYYLLAKELNMDTLVEIHDESELDIALEIKAPLIGINNRNLITFESNLDTSIVLKEKSPIETFFISESGISTVEDIKFLRENGIYGYLIGEAFMRAPNPGLKLKEIILGE